MPQQDTSITKLLGNLETGESYALAKKLDQDTASRETIQDVETKLHNQGRAIISRAQAAYGYTYSGEIGNFRTTRGRDPVIVFLITRAS